MIIVNYSVAFKALNSFVDKYNELSGPALHKLKTGAVCCAKELIRIYGISLLKVNSFAEIDKQQLPSLHTNNQQLAKMVKCSSRSIQRYILHLQKAGIISGKKYHGSNANYEVWIKPEILCIGEKLDVDKVNKELEEALEEAEKEEQKQGLAAEQKTNCPHTYSSNSKYTTNLLIDVETVENPRQKNSFTGNTGEIASLSSKNRKQVARKIFESSSTASSINTGEIASRLEEADKGPVAPADPERELFLNIYPKLLWNMARNLLYKNMDLTEHQIESGKKLVRHLYSKSSIEKIPDSHQIYVDRIALVAKYIAKKPECRFVPIPTIYFDTTNPTGFVGTKNWYIADQQRKKEIERELILKRLIRKYTNNLKQEACKRLPPLKLFRQCENTLGKLGEPGLVQKFHASVLHYECYGQLEYSHN